MPMPSDIPPKAKAVYGLIRDIRAAFNELASLSDRMIADLDMTAAMRAVLEHLRDGGPATVPEIARAKSVTRQHIQILADALTARGLTDYTDNPAHKRSKLLALSETGAARFSEVQRREEEVLQRLAVTMGGVDIEAARDAIAALRRALRGEGVGG
jgi:DNA-binding MarR family transcriptional regulator